MAQMHHLPGDSEMLQTIFYYHHLSTSKTRAYTIFTNFHYQTNVLKAAKGRLKYSSYLTHKTALLT